MVNEECYPYLSGRTGSVEKCKASRRATLSSMQCQLVNASPKRLEEKRERRGLFRTPPAYRIAPKEEDIMNEIRERGPVQGEFNFNFLIL